MTRPEEYVLWLPSWYPNEFEPYNGDFVQRHAIATAEYCKITVFHFIQLGPHTTNENTFHKKHENGNLIEYLIAPSFKPTGNKIFDKLNYNLKFYRSAKTILINHFKQHGLPKIVHVHVPIKAGNLAIWIKRKYGVNYILSEHSSHYLINSTDSYFKKSIFYKTQVKRVFKHAELVTNVSQFVGEILKKTFSLKRVFTIHNTVNTDEFNFQVKRQQNFTYIHVSSLKKQKNIIGLLNAFENLNKVRQDWNLILVGPSSDELETMISAKGLIQRVTLHGEVSYEEVASIMKNSHVFVLFSNHENFPCVIIEALCCGLPIISSNVAGIKEAVNEENGILIKPMKEDDLLTALLKIRSNYSHYNLKKISDDAIQKYNYKAIGKQFFNLYSLVK